VDTVAHYDNTTTANYVNSPPFAELSSGCTENRAVWNKGSHSILVQLKELEAVGPFNDGAFSQRQRQRVHELAAARVSDGPVLEGVADAQPGLPE
jgi:hypothetical protein